jgi:hypothetical protein
MKRSEFKQIVTLAMSTTELPGYLSVEVTEALGGCANDTLRRFVTKEQVAAMIRGTCQTFAGTWDFTELEELQNLSKRFDIIGG